MKRIAFGAGGTALVLWLAVNGLFQCASQKTKAVENYDLYFQKGQEAFNKKRWDKAIENFTLVVLNSPGGDLADDAQFYLGECYFNRKEYLLAISEYQRLTERYIYSPLAEDANYKIALSQFKEAPRYQRDQEYALSALQSFQDFIDTYPNSKYYPEAERKIGEIRSRLARKMYESGRLYRKLEQWESAIIYLDKTLELYYDTEWITKAKLEKAHCLIRLRQFDQYQQLLKEIKIQKKFPPTSEELTLLERIYLREQKRIAREEHKKTS